MTVPRWFPREVSDPSLRKARPLPRSGLSLAVSTMSTERKCCQKLRELDDAVEKQRKFVGELKAQGLAIEGERDRLTQLLTKLERTLHAMSHR